VFFLWPINCFKSKQKNLEGAIMNLSRLITVFAAMLLFAALNPATRVDAVLITLNSGETATFTYDGATASPSCTLCDASITFTFNGSSLDISFTNTSTDNLAGVNVLTQFGFDSTPNLTFGTATFGGDASTGWEFKTNGLGGFEFGATHPGIQDALEGGETGTVSVPITSPSGVLSLAIDQTQTHFQEINFDGSNDSTKPQGGVCTTNCTPPTTVPEPTSLVLAGLGLVMLAAVARQRMRR